MDCKELDEIIYGRIEPHIYAFNTNEIPNYLKIGDTYRPVKIRLDEWRHVFPNLEQQFESPATVSEDIYFRDYSIHQYLENEKKKHRLTEKDLNRIFPDCAHYSNEFFENTNNSDVEEAITDIKQEFNKSDKYSYYSTSDKQSQDFIYQRSSEIWKPRPNQEEAIERFVEAYNNGRKNLLMYAVMRFGKSFTSMCCAKKINAKFVVVVSAKADVKTEWKKTVEIPGNFKNYEFIESKDLKVNENLIKEKLRDNKSVVCFLTLQDLQGDDLKTKHTQVFDNKIELLIVDETHFGARAESYGKVLRTDPKFVSDTSLKKIKSEDEFLETEDAEKIIKSFSNVKIRLHLSGTPYRILMGSEFEKEDIISFCQFADIVHEQEEWESRNIQNGEQRKEWENPYYGFPQMVRFAFNPNESSRKKLEELRKNGSTYAFSALFRPKSITKDDTNKLHKKFENEREILDLLEVIDGIKEDKELLGFLDYDKIKEGKMCRHMIAVLPYCASCDALEDLIISNKEKFKNLNTYKIINISGVDNNTYKKVEDVKSAIKKAETENVKTLTLTVNRMLTGSTVEQWDTMLYFKDTSSPQEYDQAIFRLQNQYIKIFTDEKTGDEIKYNMKPQTLLVDFDPLRMFTMQEMKSKIYNVNTDESGNSKLLNRLTEELRISPIITTNKNKLIQITPTDILQAISEYSRNKGVAEETVEIPVDYKLFDIPEIKIEIEKQGELGSKEGFSVVGASGEGNEFDFGDDSSDDKGDDGASEPANEENVISDSSPQTEDDIESMIKKWRTYYARILFFAFLTKDKVISLQQIIDIAEKDENPRIINNLALNIKVLVLMQKYMDKFGLSQLDYKIQNINKLASDDSVEPLERAMTALKKFGRLSESEVVTPNNVCDDMIGLISDEKLINCIENNKCILDINSKLAEFAISLYKRYTQKLNIEPEKFNTLIYAIPSSKHTYEFTRKIYEILGLSINNIAKKFVSYDLLKIKNEDEKIDYESLRNTLNKDISFDEITLSRELDLFDENDGENDMKFDVIVGNPPYQENVGNKGSNRALAKQLFPSFIMLAIELNPSIVSLITPTRWFTGEGQDKSFPKLRNYFKSHNHISKIVSSNSFFEGVSVGNTSYFSYEKDYTGLVEFSEIQDGVIDSVKRPLFEEGMDEILSLNILTSFIKKIKTNDFISFSTIASVRNPYKVPDVNSKLEKLLSEKKDSSHKIKIQCVLERTMYISEKEIKDNKDLVKKWKVYNSKMNGGAGTLMDGKPVSIIGRCSIGEPDSICSGGMLSFGNFDTEIEAINLKKYMETKFLRFMVGVMKTSQALYQNVYRFVPLQDFTSSSDIDWSKTISEIDKQLYEKYKLDDEEINFIEKRIKPME